MNKRFLTTTLLAGSMLFIAGCGGDSPFDPNASSSNSGPISQNNFTILFSEPAPKFFDPATGDVTAVTSDISVQIGDNNNQLITGSHTIYFRTEWGLIDPSCTTKDGGCSVTWKSGSPDTMPNNFLNDILAYASSGQESFDDFNGNGVFDDGDIFYDTEEPYLDIDDNGIFSTGDLIVDTVNGLDLTGADETHNGGDTLFNGPNCSHTVLCSPTRATTTVWESGTLWLNGGATFSVGGTVTTVGTIEIQNNGGSTLIITADSTFAYTVLGGTGYNIIVSNNGGLSCTVINGFGTASADVTDVVVTCATTTYTIGGTVAGIPATESLTIQNNFGDDLTLTDADTTFVFATPIADGSPYAVSVLTDPATAACTIANNSGNVPGADVINVGITCVNSFTIGGTVSIPVGETLVIQNNFGDDLTLTDADTTFVFATRIADGLAYDVTQFSYTNLGGGGPNCAFTNGAGNVPGANVINVDIVCP